VSFITQIDTSTLSNQNLSSALLVHTFTNTTRPRKVFVTIDADQIAGDGDYTPYATVQRAGAGSAFQIVPASAVAVASGITAASFVTIPVILNATDVLKVYLTGLAGDTTTPDITVRVWEELSESPTHETTIATLASQTSFTLTTGSVDDDAYNGAEATILDTSTAVQKATVAIGDYTGSTRTVTLVAAAAFTVAAGDRIIIRGRNLSGTTVGAVSGAVGSVTASVKIQSGHPKNTALSNFMFFMVDSSDHITSKTGLTITATRSLDGAAFAACANSASEVGNGVYKITLAAADMNADTVMLRFTGTGADARLIELITTPS